MDNASKALYMAGSLLIALLVISLLVYAFTNIGGLQDEKDKIETEEEIIAFNTEYESFDKSIMYGVDVISCINKAINHNEKYVVGGSQTLNAKYGSEALIQVQVILNKEGKNPALHESVDIYHFNENGREVKYSKSDLENKCDINITWGNIWSEASKTSANRLYKANINNKDDVLSNIKNNDNLKSLPYKDIITTIDANNFYLLNTSSGRTKNSFNVNEKSIYYLAKKSGQIEVIIENNSDTKTDSRQWSYIKWTTCLSDFKKRKYFCKNIEYDGSSGLVNNIVFQEK